MLQILDDWKQLSCFQQKNPSEIILRYKAYRSENWTEKFRINYYLSFYLL